MAKAVLTCDMVSKRSQDSGFSLVYTPNALPGKNSPTANKHMGKRFDRVKLVSLCTSHSHVCHHTVSRNPMRHKCNDPAAAVWRQWTQTAHHMKLS